MYIPQIIEILLCSPGERRSDREINKRIFSRVGRWSLENEWVAMHGVSVSEEHGPFGEPGILVQRAHMGV